MQHQPINEANRPIAKQRQCVCHTTLPWLISVSLDRNARRNETRLANHRVRDVETSSEWYQSILGCANSHPGTTFDQIIDADGTVLVCLHHWGEHEHPSLMSPETATPRNGLLLFFRVDDFDAALHRARALVGRFEEEPHKNPNTGTLEFSVRDPDGYYVTVNAV